jgi:hypothetical protein
VSGRSHAETELTKSGDIAQSDVDLLRKGYSWMSTSAFVSAHVVHLSKEDSFLEVGGLHCFDGDGSSKPDQLIAER